MDVRIGVTYSAKEIDIEMPDDADRKKLRGEIEKALADSDSVMWLTDRRGREVGIPADKVAYVEIGSSEGDRRIGFAG